MPPPQSDLGSQALMIWDTLTSRFIYWDGSITSTGFNTVDITQLGGNNIAVGNGITTNGTLRVAIASDSSPVVIGAGTAVIGHVIVDSAPITHVIADSGTITTVSAVTSITNPVHAIIDSGTLTAITSITNPVSVTQGTSPWVISGSTTVSGTVAATQSGTWSVRTQDGSGNALTSTGSALDVNLKTSSITLPVSGTITANQGTANATPWNENIAQINGVTVLMGSGATGTGSQRVTVAVDSATVAGSSSLPAGSNVIGHVITDTGSTTAVTGNVTVVQPTGTNLHIVVDSFAQSIMTPVAPTAATVGVASAQVVASNSNRRSLILVNTSANSISLGFGANAAVLNSGITLLPGASWSMDAFSFFTVAVNAIASAASSNLAVQEFT